MFLLPPRPGAVQTPYVFTGVCCLRSLGRLKTLEFSEGFAVDPLIRDVSFGSRMSTRTVFWQHKWPPGQDFGSKTATRTVLWQQNDHALEPKRIPLFWQQFWQYTWRPELRVGCKDCHQNYNVAARQRPGICFGCRCKAATRTVFG